MKIKCNETPKCRGRVVVTFKFRGFDKVHCQRHWNSSQGGARREMTNVEFIATVH